MNDDELLSVLHKLKSHCDSVEHCGDCDLYNLYYDECIFENGDSPTYWDFDDVNCNV